MLQTNPFEKDVKEIVNQFGGIFSLVCLINFLINHHHFQAATSVFGGRTAYLTFSVLKETLNSP